MMADDVQRTYEIRTDVLIQKCDEKDITFKQLAAIVQMDVKSIRRIKSGQVKPYHATVEALAKALGITIAELVKPEIQTSEAKANQPKLYTEPVDLDYFIPEDIKLWNEDLFRSTMSVIASVIGPGKRIRVMSATPANSTKLTLRMSREDADGLRQAFLDGRLPKDKVLNVSEPRPVDHVPDADSDLVAEQVTLTPSIPFARAHLWRKWVTVSRLFTITGLLCSLSEFFPIESFPIFLLGIFIGLLAIGIRLRTKASLWLPSIAIALNTGGAIAWPYAIGLFHDDSGYHLRADERVRYGEVQVILDDSFPDDVPYSVYVSEGPLGGHPDVVKVHFLRFTGRGSAAAIVKSRRYNVFYYVGPHLMIVDGPDNIYVWPSIYGKTTIRPHLISGRNIQNFDDARKALKQK